MIQWVHAGVGIVTLLVLCIFMIIYIGVYSSVTTRICGAPLPGLQGARGARGARGLALAPGPTGKQSTVPGPEGDVGPDALGIMTGGTPLPAGTGFWTGNTGLTGYPGPEADLLDPIGAPPVNFRFLNNGIGSDLDRYDDSGYFTINLDCGAGAPTTQQTQARFVRLGSTVIFQVKQVVFNHGGPLTDWITFRAGEFVAYQERFFFAVTPFATTAYVLGQTVIVFDRVPFTDGLFRLQIEPGGKFGQPPQMRIQYRDAYATAADNGTMGSLNNVFNSKFNAAGGPGTFGLATEMAITWSLT